MEVIMVERGLFRCPVKGCGKQSNRKHNIQMHLRRHTKEKPFRCGFADCTMAFGWKSSLNQHERLHERDGDVRVGSRATGESHGGSGLGSAGPSSPAAPTSCEGKVPEAVKAGDVVVPKLSLSGPTATPSDGGGDATREPPSSPRMAGVSSPVSDRSMSEISHLTLDLCEGRKRSLLSSATTWSSEDALLSPLPAKGTPERQHRPRHMDLILNADEPEPSFFCEVVLHDRTAVADGTAGQLLRCPVAACPKLFTRAEDLSVHQLQHTSTLTTTASTGGVDA